jgi:predicted adenine nucleotide alpha hydrolase (AANH) superfamily ATPase
MANEVITSKHDALQRLGVEYYLNPDIEYLLDLKTEKEFEYANKLGLKWCDIYKSWYLPPNYQYNLDSTIWRSVAFNTPKSDLLKLKPFLQSKYFREHDGYYIDNRNILLHSIPTPTTRNGDVYTSNGYYFYNGKIHFTDEITWRKQIQTEDDLINEVKLFGMAWSKVVDFNITLAPELLN